MPVGVRESSSESAGRAALLVLAAMALTVAVQIRDGLYQPVAIGFLVLTVFLAFAGVLSSAQTLEKLRFARALWPSLVCCLFLSFILAAISVPGAYRVFQSDVTQDGVKQTIHRGLEVYWALTAVAAIVCGYLLSSRSRGGPIALPILVAIFLSQSIWLIRHDPHPHVDVFVFADESCAAICHGIDPYAITFTDIYNGQTKWYGPGLVQDGRLLFGYPYMPLTLFATIPGWLFGDPRYAGAVAIALSAILIVRARPGPIATLAAAALLFMPRTLYVIDNAWSEPIPLLFLSLAIWCGCRKPRVAPYAIGLLMASKQYMPFVLILTPLLFGWDGRRFLATAWRACAVAIVVTLPLALVNVATFMHSAVLLQFAQPFRDDALSFMAAWSHALDGRWQPPFLLAFTALALAGTLALWRVRPSPSGFAMAVAVCLLAFFAFNKQAFANYYFLVLGAMWCAVATNDWPDACTTPRSGRPGPTLMGDPASVR